MLLLRSPVAIVGYACIILSFSELIFVNEWVVRGLVGHGLDASAIVAHMSELLLYYAVFGAALYALWPLVKSAAGLILAGSLVGWCIETAFVPVAYEAPPVSYIWTSVGWHALLDVVLGCYLWRRWMRRLPAWRMLAVSVVFGLFWAVWSTWTWTGDDPAEIMQLDPAQFWILISTIAGLWTLGLILADLGGVPRRVPRWFGLLLSLILLGLWAINALGFPLAALPLLALAALTLIALRREGGLPGPGLAEDLSGRPPLWTYATPMISALVAVTAYERMIESNFVPPAHDIIWILVLSGFLALIWALWRCLRSTAETRAQPAD